MSAYASCFARNLRALRESKGLTQKEFAQILGFSEKTISKWECEESIPSIDVLFDIARYFQTSVEALFRGDETYFLGIDGGGTKTDLVLSDVQGTYIRTLTVSGCNPVDIGFDAAAERLKQAIYEICRDIPLSCVYAFAGIAGGISAGMQERFHAFFETFHFKAFANHSDNSNAIAAGLGKRDGISMTLGTGICAFIQKDRRFSRVGGWGYLIDDGGSGYNLGRDALNAYFCALDGTGPATLLSELIDAMLPGGSQKIIEFIYRDSKKAIASFAPAVFKAVEADDPVAKRILERNIRVIVHLIETAAKSFSDETIPVVLVGGLTQQPIVMESIQAMIHNPERYDFQTLNGKPVDGAVILARELAEQE